MIKDAFKYLLFGLVPPERPDSGAPPEQHACYQKKKRRWARFVAASLWIGAVLFVALSVPTYGRMFGVRWFGDAIAWTSDLKAQIGPLEVQLVQVTASQDEMLLSQYRADLDRARARQCKAIADGDAERKEIYRQQIDAIQKKYRAIAGVEWRIPECEEY